ncbi:MAG: glycoside hydrolase/phage tail family protein [Hyphomicrobiales bacterium]|nr:glycoside hydrolase TIM-barrel-like domain-containing protein [Hyphomicrobiales bacterium]MDE2017340.1 glycoside hydrolase/phage tail family protein [Hyphomicrobiales bacterium]
MATLLLQAAGAAVGGFVGGPVGAVIGRAIGGMGGALIDSALLGGGKTAIKGPRVPTTTGVSSTPGAPVPRLYGRARLGGQVIWATPFDETSTTQRVGGSGGKGGGGSKVTTYAYDVSFAVAICEGPIAGVRRIWADGKELDQTPVTMRVYLGDETQQPDPLIVATDGAADAPAYRGTAYVVFEKLPLKNFGNRIPQMTFETLRPVGGLAAALRAVAIIPGSTEFGYSPSTVTLSPYAGVTRGENRLQTWRASDWAASIDALQAVCPNLASVSLVVTWFGDDLRAETCTIAPRVESAAKPTSSAWSVAGLSRGAARVVSQFDGAPAFGGTPDDSSVVAALQDLKTRGLAVTFYPFVSMDVPAGNALTDPWTGAWSQPAYPWRGRIVCDPAPGVIGSPDATPAAGAQVAAFFGSSAPPATEWSFRRFVLHCADLCAQAGGVESFLVGSELAALTRVRSAPGVYPAASALARLAADVKAKLGAATKVSYGADWTEYGSHVLSSGAEVRFPLDPLWSSPAVDFVGIDAYWPLSDWRDGDGHLDAQIARSVHDPAYLLARVASGEDFDWYYASDADRAAQARTPIADGAYGKPWVFRAKDLVGWWGNPHVERMGGVELAAPTAWVAQGKPIRLTEIGCPAVDRGANAPNMFPDPKSSASGLPPFSRGGRDDLMQSRALVATMTRFDAALPGFQPAFNPASSVYGGPMVDPAHVHVWCWDARPFPAFPALSSQWADAANYATGHWINGRVDGMGVDALVAAIVNDSGVLAVTLPPPPIDGFLEGFAMEGTMSARGALDPLGALFGFEAAFTGGQLRFVDRRGAPVAALGQADFVPDKDGKTLNLTRAQEIDLPHELAVHFADAEMNYLPGVALSRRLAGSAKRQVESDAPAVLRGAAAGRLADMALADASVARETATFELSPATLALEIGDVVTLPVGGVARPYQLTKIADGPTRRAEARAVSRDVYDAVELPTAAVGGYAATPGFAGQPRVAILDLALARGDPTTLQSVAAFADPWPGALALYRATSSSSYALAAEIDLCAIMGDTLTELGPGTPGLFDMSQTLDVRMFGGALSSVSDEQALAGETAMAIQGADGSWEVFSFADAVLVGQGVYRLSRLVRGLGGEEALCERTVPAGATVVSLDGAVTPLVAGVSALGVQNSWKLGPLAQDYATSAFASFTTAATGKALMPYAPVQAAATRSAAGVTIAFKRRGRVDSDAWEPLDIPLGEDSEAYQVDVLKAGAVVRTLAATSPSALYPAAQELADFGATQSALSVAIYQMSAEVGRGFPLAATLAIQ